MDEKSISKIKAAWEPARILQPIKTELYLNIIDQVASLFSVGSFYYYIINFNTLQIEYIDGRIEQVLGIDKGNWSLDKMFDLIHPEDLKELSSKEAKAVDFVLNKITPEDVLRYKIVYAIRLRHANGSYRTILQQSKALTTSGDGKVQQVLGIHTDVTYLNIPIDHKMSFIGDGDSPSYYSLSTDSGFEPLDRNYHKLFTHREKEILRSIAKGYTFNEIAELLNISPHTINTHKKNMLKKTDCKNTTELVARCVRDGVI